jgi:hypothetical protein
MRRVRGNLWLSALGAPKIDQWQLGSRRLVCSVPVLYAAASQRKSCAKIVVLGNLREACASSWSSLASAARMMKTASRQPAAHSSRAARRPARTRRLVAATAAAYPATSVLVRKMLLDVSMLAVSRCPPVAAPKRCAALLALSPVGSRLRESHFGGFSAETATAPPWTRSIAVCCSRKLQRATGMQNSPPRKGSVSSCFRVGVPCARLH